MHLAAVVRKELTIRDVFQRDKIYARNKLHYTLRGVLFFVENQLLRVFLLSARSIFIFTFRQNYRNVKTKKLRLSKTNTRRLNV